MATAIIPHLVVRNAAEAIDFYREVFGFEQMVRMPAPDGRVMHCALKLGGHEIFVCDEFPGSNCKSPETAGGSSVTIHVVVPNADETYKKAIANGARGTMPPQDMFWGDRYGQFVDPFGHPWAVAHNVEKVTPEQMRQRAAALFAKGKGA